MEKMITLPLHITVVPRSRTERLMEKIHNIPAHYRKRVRRERKTPLPVFLRKQAD